MLGLGNIEKGWDLFEPDGKKLLYELKARRLKKQFDNNGAYPYTKMLEKQVKGKNNSWAIRWHASAFLKGKLTLYPGNSLIKNIGLDDSGTHCSTSNEYDTQISMESIAIGDIPIHENILAKKIIEKYFKSLKPNFMNRIKNRFHTILMNIYSLIRYLSYRTYKYGWFGNYSSWQDAKKDSVGYDSDLILEKVKNSLLKVKNGEAIYERDSILFDKMEYSWPLLAALLWIANKNMAKLNIIDFGILLNRQSLWSVENVILKTTI